jgi:hypothetical protein
MADLSLAQVIARIERMRDTCKTDESIANEHDRPDDAVWARDNVETLDACLILLRQEQGWQPIESAPKDGQQVWLWWDGKRRLAHWHEAVNPPSIGGKFANWLTDDKGSVSAVTKPTLWAPLPSPPSDSEAI